MASDSAGTGFAPFPPDEGAATGSGKKGAPDPAISSACEVPPYAAPVCLCLRFMPHRRGTHFSVHILDLDWQVDMAEARAVVGTGKVLTGNLDPVSAVKESTPQAIRNDVLRIYDTVGDPYMVGAGCEIPAGTPEENVKALCTPVACKTP